MKKDFTDPDWDVNFEGEEEHVAFKRLRECKRCGKGGLEWEEDSDGRFFLFDARTGRTHQCDSARVHRGLLRDIPDLSR